MTKRFTGEFDKQYSGVHDNGEQLTNFEVVDLLNNLSEDNEYLEKRFKEEEWHYDHIDEDRDVWRYKCQELEKENKQLKKQLQKIQDSFEVSWTQNYIEFDKDKLYIQDNNTEIRLDGRNLFIEVYIPQIDEYYRFRYIVTGRSSKMREFIKYYNSSGDDE